jgi:hypothetical protein
MIGRRLKEKEMEEYALLCAALNNRMISRAQENAFMQSMHVM